MLLKIPAILTPDELRQLREALATIKFEDGRATAGAAAAPQKHNLQAARRGSEGFQHHQQLVADALMRNEAFRAWALPLRLVPPMFNRYDAGMYYGDHVDNAMMAGAVGPVRSDLAVTIFLSDLADYDGGELVMHSNHGGTGVRLEAGGALVYPATSVHRVQPVTRGARYAAVTWAQSMVRDGDRREVLAELASLARWARGVSPESPEALALGKLRANLVRMWAEV